MDHCLNCGKEISENQDGAVTLCAGGQDGQSYCSTHCFSSGLKKRTMTWRKSGNDLKKYIKAMQKEYNQKRIKQIRKKKFLDQQSDDIYYLFESLSPKQKRICAMKGFGWVVSMASNDVKKIFEILNKDA